MKKHIFEIQLEPELARLIEEAVQRTGLNKPELLREALRKGIPSVIDTFQGLPRTTLVDALLKLKGLEIPQRRQGMGLRSEPRRSSGRISSQ